MSDDLLPYYNQELTYIRRLAADFATAHPKIAGRLRLGPDTIEDPHVSRLLEGFAYLNARIRQKLDDEFPELTDSLLEALCPYYLSPIPSMSIVDFALDRGQGGLAEGYTIPAGSQLESEPLSGQPCFFRTCYPAVLFPVEVTQAEYSGPPFKAPACPARSESNAILRIRLQCYDPAMTFADLQMSHLRFYLNAPAPYVYSLYEAIFNNTLQVALVSHAQSDRPFLLSPDCLQTVGFGPEDEVIPTNNRTFSGYRMLTEFFTFPAKFLFFDLTKLTPEARAHLGNECEVYFYLKHGDSTLEKNVSAESFRLGCTPIVNLFKQRAEPIALNQTALEYRVVPDSRRPLAMEVHSIDRVIGTSPQGKRQEYAPLYSFQHSSAVKQTTFWHASRRPAQHKGDSVDHGTEVYLSFVDLNLDVSAPPAWTLHVETTCLNRDLPRQLPFGGGQPKLRLSEAAPLSGLRCLIPPTPTRRPPLRHGARWRLISHLMLNHLSISGADMGAKAMREILSLYDFADSPETRSIIAGLISVTSRPTVQPLRDEFGSSFVRGTEITIELDEERFTGSGLFLFASVLERFLAQYCTINSFSRLVAKVRQREGELRRWPPRAGEKVLV